jgi:microcystin-dependent protein
MFNAQSKADHGLKFLLCAGLMCGSLTASAGQNEFIGEISFGGWNFAPQGTATCDGQTMSISQNTALFSLLGTTYGGNGTTFFNLPDLRGRFPMHVGQGPGLNNRVLGEMSGAESVVLNAGQLPAHTHSATTTVTVTAHANSGQANTPTPTAGVWATTGRNNTYIASAPNVDLVAGAVTATANTTVGPGGSANPTPVSILPPYTVMTCVIYLQGIFPTRP